MKIKIKFGALMFGIMLSTVFLMIYTMIGLTNNITVTKEQQNKNSPLMINSLVLQSDIIQIQQWLTDISATRAAVGFDDGFSEAETYYQDAKTKLDLLSKLGAEPDTIKTIATNLEEYYQMGIDMANTYINEGTEKGNTFMDKFDPYSEKMQASIEVLLKEANQDFNNGNQAIIKKNQELYYSVIIIFAIIFAIVLVSIIIIQKTVIQRLTQTTELLKEISEGEGDLTSRLNVSSKDEIGSMSLYFNKFIQTVHNIVASVKITALHLSDDSEKLANSSQQSIVTAEEIAKTVNEITLRIATQAEMTMEGSMNLKNLDKLIENSKEHINLTTESSAIVNELAKDGLINMENLAQKTEESSNAAQQVKESIIKTKASSERISEASRLITTIASRTNLIALNASIEATSAGVHGTSFQVVANEIRKLADQSTAATKSIDEMVKTLQSDATNAEVKIKEVNVIFDALTENVNLTKSQYSDISKAINESNKNVKATNDIINQMEAMKNQVLEVMNQLSEVAEENASGTQEISASIEEQTVSFELIAKSSADLTDLFKELQNMIERFKVD